MTTDRLRQARRRLNSALIAVEPHLSTPYPDAPDWTPWTRFVAPALKELAAALGAVEPVPVDVALLRQAETYLATLHEHAARHDNLGADFTCAGCALRKQIAALPADRYRLAWQGARQRAAVLSAELTRRAPLLGEYAAENTTLHQWHDEDRTALTEMRATIERLRTELADRSYDLNQAAMDAVRYADEVARLRTEKLAASADRVVVLPLWEAVYEPGNVSDYLIGYANDQDPATGMAEAWLRSQAEVTGRLEWVADEQLATGRYDRWYELIEHHDDGVPTGPGIIVRRMADEAKQTVPRPPITNYVVEIFDADEWLLGTARTSDLASSRAKLRARRNKWPDMPLRIVRSVETYTVVEVDAPTACVSAPCSHPGDCRHGCRAAADQLTQLGQDMQAGEGR